MTDLQCPATMVLLTPDTLVGCDARAHRLAGVFVASSIAANTRSLAEAKRLAAEHGCSIAMADLVDGLALAEEIDQLADAYRGETVAIVAPPSAICTALARAGTPTQPIIIAVDSAGRTVLT